MKHLIRKNYLWAVVAVLLFSLIILPASTGYAQLNDSSFPQIETLPTSNINTGQVNKARDVMCGTNADCKTGFNEVIKNGYGNISTLCKQTGIGGLNRPVNEFDKPYCAAGASMAGQIKTDFEALTGSGGACGPPMAQSAVNNCVNGFYRGLQGAQNNCSGATKSACTKAFETGKDNNEAAKTQITAAKNASSGPGSTTSTSGSTEPDIECSDSDTLSWIVCPVIESISTVLTQMDSAINNLLTVNTDKLFGGAGVAPEDQDISNAYYKAWATFRTIALGFVVIMALVVIISTAFGYDILDAYTIRKVLPRLLIAIIGITLSWGILSFLISLTNDVGNGIRAIIYAPFNGLDANGGSPGGNINFDDGIGPILTAFSIGTVLVMQSVGVLAMAGVALIAVICAFLTLVLRELIVIVLVITAPLGIACIILPNTRKFWQFWQTTLAAMLIAFPFIAAMIAIGKVFSKITLEYSENELIYNMIALIAYITPYFLLPFAFKFAGGLLGTLSGSITARGGGLSGGLSKYAGNKRQERLHKMADGKAFNPNSRVGSRVNTITGGVAGIPRAGKNPFLMGSRYRDGMAQHHFQDAMEMMEKDPSFSAFKNDDDLLSVARRGGLRTNTDFRNALVEQDRRANPGRAGRFVDANGNVAHGAALDAAASQIWRARQNNNESALRMAATMSLPATGSGFSGGFSEMAGAIAETAHGDENTATRMYGYMKGQATRAGRLDLGGSGFGAGNEQLMHAVRHDSVDKNGNAVTAETMNDAVALNALQQNDGVTLARARNESSRNIIGAATRRIEKLQSSGTTTAAQQQEIQMLTATVENLRDTSANYGSARTTQIIQEGDGGQQGISSVTQARQAVSTQYRRDGAAATPEPTSEYDLQRPARRYDPSNPNDPNMKQGDGEA